MFIADLHIHSYLSRATAKNLDLEHLNLWAQLKGIGVVGTGDFTHPRWFSELKEKLQEAEPGLFALRPEFSGLTQPRVPPSCNAPVRFMLSVEISCIYKKNGMTRKNHNVVFVPDFETAERLNRNLERIGNIRSDGRPILGLDAHDLLEIVLDVSPQAHLVPAHVWTPWFSLFGSKSGFDSLEECFGDLSSHIFAVETGLSSDPPMNWRLSALDRVALVSNSDAHSPANLGREANIFDTGLSYSAIFEALKSKDPRRFLGTIEFFPEEGKYHYDGHRKCNMRMSPKETIQSGGLCPKCGRPVTVGVMHRVEELADRQEGVRPPEAAPFRSLLTLPDILAQAKGVGRESKRVQAEYFRLLEEYGPEFRILMDLPLEELEAGGHGGLAEGLRRMRQGRVEIRPGYDGEFGSVVLFSPEERRGLSGQASLIPLEADRPGPEADQRVRPLPTRQVEHGLETRGAGSADLSGKLPAPSRQRMASLLRGLNSKQQQAVRCWERPLLIVAGPGTGKTLTLTRRIAFLIDRGIARPEQVLAITFTNKAAEEMEERLALLLGDRRGVTVETFHALGYEILKGERDRAGVSGGFRILDEAEAEAVLARVTAGLSPSFSHMERRALLEEISRAKQNLRTPETFEEQDPDFARLYRLYEQALRESNMVDLDDLIARPVRLLEEDGEALGRLRERYRFVSIDEYQDINYAQYRLVRLLSPRGENLCAIGDPHQAIYGFRGADSRYFLRFKEDYPEAEIIRLEQNFRSSETILQASSVLLNQGPDPLGIRLWSGISGESFLSMLESPTDRAEAESIVHTIEELLGGTSHFSLDSGRVETSDDRRTRSFSDFAVLYRFHFQGEVLEEAFERSGIPFCRVGGEALSRNEEVRKVLQVLREHCEEGDSLHPEGDRSRDLFGEKAGDLTSAGRVIRRVIDSLGFDPDQPGLDSLVRLADGWGGEPAEFPAMAALHKDLDTVDPRAEKVRLMTLHAAKGLEFPVVFIAGCEAGLLPYRPEGWPCPPIEEERRLFYVGLTRAREKVILSRARKRRFFGRTRVQAPSPFLREIEEYVRRMSSGLQKRPSKTQQIQLKLF
ncbi:MAG: UvrD-helicase domain-containing protein [Deltaproteobacteria bacterium]|nr:UvrD-helicase domain-containing protein [Deltaproteobacteria bacterium]